MLPSGIIEALKFASFADGLGAVGGFSLKKITIMTATTIPMIAWHNKELKIQLYACFLYSGRLSSSSTNKAGITKPTATPKGIATVAMVVATILYKKDYELSAYSLFTKPQS